MTRHFVHERRGNKLLVIGALVLGVGAYLHHTQHQFKEDLKVIIAEVDSLKKELKKIDPKN